MLEELIIRDYALIDRLQVSFSNGFNVLSGETGAGKSIIVGSLGFLLGAKADSEAIRSGCEEASVSAVVSVCASNHEALKWLLDHDMSLDDGRVMLRRVLKSAGRSTSYVQGIPVARAELEAFTAALFDIHGQHEHQSLIKTEVHRQYLDAYAGLLDELRCYNELFVDVTSSRKALAEARDNEKGREERIELLRFGIEEIEKAAVRPGEIAELESEAARLSGFEKLALFVNTAAENAYDGELPALESLRKLRSSLEQAQGIDSSLESLCRRISDLYYEFEDTCTQLRSYQESLVWDPGRLETIEERLAFLFKLKKKYGQNEEEILAWKDKAIEDCASLERIEEDRSALEKELLRKERELLSLSSTISESRRNAAKELSSKITGVLRTLGMSKAEFCVSVADKTRSGEQRVLGPWGADEIEFLISANQGEPLKALRKIASGGELSRLMLAIKTVLASSDTVETMVFDEIDTGIGGEVALSVGEHLCELGKHRQIFCITHLATIAVRADNHVKVSKKMDGQRTFTVIDILDTNSRREEIARMLSGDSVAQAALAHADELLSRYQTIPQGGV